MAWQRWSRRTGLALALVGLGSCASLGRGAFQEPEVSLRGVTVRGVGLQGGSLDLELMVRNPNRFNVQGTRLEFALDVEGERFGVATFEDPFALPQGEWTPLIVPLRFEWAGLGAAARAALGYGEVAYRLSGAATLRTPLGRRVVPFARRGSVPLITASRGSPS